MTGENDNYEIETINPECESKSKNMITIENTIEHTKNMKNTLNSAMDSVISLMREVEHKEKVAEQAAENIGKSSLGILAKVDELKQVKLIANETNQTHAKEVYAESNVLAAEMDELQVSVAGLLNIEDCSVGVLDEMRRSLEIRLITALAKKEESEKDNLNIEVSARKALAYEESQMEKVARESERLKREAVKNSKLRELLTHHGQEVTMLCEEITCIWQDVYQLKAKLDQGIVLRDILSSSRTLCEPQIENIIDSNEFLEESTDQLADDHAESANPKQLRIINQQKKYLYRLFDISHPTEFNC